MNLSWGSGTWCLGSGFGVQGIHSGGVGTTGKLLSLRFSLSQMRSDWCWILSLPYWTILVCGNGLTRILLPAAVVTTPDHVRDIDLFVRRYNVRAYGPMFFFPDDVPNSKLEPIIADSVLPGGLVALYDGRGRLETPLWLPKHRVIVFGDALTERDGELRVWDSRAGHEKRELPALRAMLDLPFERVIISHCDNEPVHSRAEFEKALRRPPWRHDPS